MPARSNPATGPNALEIGGPEGSVHLEPVHITIDEVTLLGSQLVLALDCNMVMIGL
jgi:hypothetical protein